MRPRYLCAIASAAAAAALLAGGIAITPASAATSGVRPEHVYAPYFEAYLPGSVSAIARQSGARYLTLAFVQAAGKKGSAACTLTWNGGPPVRKGRYRSGIRWLRAHGGDVIVSFGGYSADHDGTEIADACHSSAKIAKAYERLVQVYGLHRLDMDVEDNSLLNKPGIDRRNKAIAILQAWARARNYPLWIQYTLGVEPNGFDQNTLGILRDAVRNHARINSVNMMVFDYYLGNETKPLDMGKLAVESARSVHTQLRAIWPNLSGRRIWHRLGFTLLPGIDDYPAKTEVTSLSDTRYIRNFASANGMDFFSIWALQRDNGGCPGAIDSNTCSGIKQPAWAFSHLLEGFTG